jgi:maleate cis-trans isomerase
MVVHVDEPLRLGFILPDDGPFDYEWLRLEPWLASCQLGDVCCLVERSPADGIMRPGNLAAIGAEGVLAPCARRLGAAGARVVAWACTSGSFIGGLARAREQVRDLESASGTPATSTSLALAAAALDAGAREIDLLSAYDEEVTRVLVGILEASGILVGTARCLGCVETGHSFAIDVATELRSFAAEVGGDRPILVPDTAINTLTALPRLQEAAGRPVITAKQATLWHAMRLAGCAPGNVFGTFGLGTGRTPG